MSKQINFVQAINWALHDAMEQDKSTILLGEDVADEEGGGVVKVTQGLSANFGTDRVRSTPIAEEAIIGAAIGYELSKKGLHLLNVEMLTALPEMDQRLIRVP